MDEVAELRAEVSILAIGLADAVRESFEGAIAAQDVTRPQAGAMRVLRVHGPASQRELAAALKCDASNVTGIVDRLESRGLLERHVDPADRRVKRIHLTDAGRRVIDAVWDDACAHTPVSALEPAQLRQLQHLLSGVLTDRSGSALG